MKINRKKLYFFSEKLKKHLAQISLYPLTIVQAPSGFGKTTAVREYLKKSIHEGADEYWYTCLGEPKHQTWANICDLLAHVNGDAANKLRQLQMPAADIAASLSPVLRDIKGERETYLVIDHWELVEREIRQALLSAFSMNKYPGLHMILITQTPEPKHQSFFYNANIHLIGPSAFFIDRESTAGIFRLQGIRLSDDQLERVYACTEGWVAAIRIMMTYFMQTGSFNYNADMDLLVEAAVFGRLSPEEKEFLLTVSITDGFTALQAARMTGQEALPEAIGDLLRKNSFIKYFPDTGMYTIHRTLQDYLRNRFYRLMPESFQKQVLRQVGHCYAADAQLLEASRLFYAVKDYDAILSLPFDVQYIAVQREKGMMAFILTVLEECSEATLLRYPFTLLMFLYGMILSGRMEDSQKLCRLLGGAIESNTAGLSWEELRRLKGEFTALIALTAHHDIRKMGKSAKAALNILGGPSGIWSKDMPWTFGNTSILCLFWREQGMLEETLQNMEECLPFQLKLTRGQGSGADSAFRAEALIVRGEDDQAEILCHRALYEARQRQQICVCLCAELTLVRIAILRGDTDGYWTALENIHSLGRENPHPYVTRMVELCVAAIDVMLHTTEHIAHWLCDIKSIEKAVYAPAVPYVQVLHSHLLVSKRQYNQLYGICQPAIDMAKNMGYLYPQVFQLLFLAAARHNGGDDGQARAHLSKALAMALPDRVYLPFAHYWNDLGGLLESIESPYDVFGGAYAAACGKARKVRLAPMPAAVFYDRLDNLKALCRRQERGTSAIKKALLKAGSPLTPREREVALLAQNRLSNKEIANKLYISEKTIKTFLQSIYIKLDVHSKAELGERNF